MGVLFPPGARGVAFLHSVQIGSGAHTRLLPPSVMVLSQRVNSQEREADHSRQSTTEIKNAWSYTCTPPYVVLIKHREIYLFSFTYAWKRWKIRL
jgi:hypothetical protein